MCNTFLLFDNGTEYFLVTLLVFAPYLYFARVYLVLSMLFLLVGSVQYSLCTCFKMTVSSLHL